jgi:hypothetical protein
MKGSITQSHGGKESPAYNKTKVANWIGRLLSKNCILKHVIGGTIDGKTEGTGRR